MSEVCFRYSSQEQDRTEKDRGGPKNKKRERRKRRMRREERGRRKAEGMG